MKIEVESCRPGRIGANMAYLVHSSIHATLGIRILGLLLSPSNYRLVTIDYGLINSIFAKN